MLLAATVAAALFVGPAPVRESPRHGLGGAALGNRVFAVEGGPRPGLAFSDAIEFIDVPPRR